MPNKRADNKRAFSITANIKQIAEIEEYCKKHGITRSEFYRLAGLAFLKNATSDSDNKESK